MHFPDYPFTPQRFNRGTGIEMSYLDEGPRDFFMVFEQQAFEIVSVLEGTPIGHEARWIDHGVCATPLRNFLKGTPLPDGIVIDPSESQRVDLCMAGGAVCVIAVRFDLLPESGLGTFRRAGFDRTHIRRWGRRSFAENGFTYPHASMHRAMTRSI